MTAHLIAAAPVATQVRSMITINKFRSDAMYLLHEALARARMRSAPRRVGTRPAREVSIAARRHRR